MYVIYQPTTIFSCDLRGCTSPNSTLFSPIPTKMPRRIISSPWGCTPCTPSGYAYAARRRTFQDHTQEDRDVDREQKRTNIEVGTALQLKVVLWTRTVHRRADVALRQHRHTDTALACPLCTHRFTEIKRSVSGLLSRNPSHHHATMTTMKIFITSDKDVM